MDIGQGNFPVLSPQQANPIGYGLTQGADLYHTMLTNALMRQYAGPQMQAELQKAQLANQLSQAQLPYAGPQAAAELAVTQAQPGLMGAQAGNLSAEAAQTRYMTGHPELLAGPVGQALFASQYAGQGLPQGQMQGGGMISTQSNMQGAQIGAGQGNLPASSSVSGYFGWPTQTTGIMSQGGLGYQTLYPGQNALVQAQKMSQVPEWNQVLNEAHQSSINAQQNDMHLQQFRDNYAASLNKGPGFGTVNPKGFLAAAEIGHDWSPEQLTDTAGTNLQLDLTRAQHFARLTNLELGTVGNAKPSRAMSQDAVNQLGPFIAAINQREREYEPFMQAAYSISQQNPAMTKQLADTLFSQYNQDYPIYNKDSKTYNPQPGNWQQYLTPAAAQAAMTGNLAKFNQNKGAQAPTASPAQNQSVVYIQDPAGQLHPIDPTKVQAALKKYPGAKVVG